jgi:hypothetical protein
MIEVACFSETSVYFYHIKVRQAINIPLLLRQQVLPKRQYSSTVVIEAAYSYERLLNFYQSTKISRYPSALMMGAAGSPETSVHFTKLRTSHPTYQRSLQSSDTVA